MPPLSTILRPSYPWHFLKSRCLRWWLNRHPNWKGAALFPPGHYHSPLLDISASNEGQIAGDDISSWQNVDLNETGQREFYRHHLNDTDRLHFPANPHPEWRYHSANDWFPAADAFLLSAVVRQNRPRRILEVGSGYSTAVVLDTLDRTGTQPEILLVEPFPDRLQTLLRPGDSNRFRLLQSSVQDVPLEEFESLSAGDILFVDSSHVAKPGSDVTFLVLRVLPVIQPGVWIHFHDMFFPESYPAEWNLEGRAWNESLFLRAFLIGNRDFQVRVFHAFARCQFEDPYWISAPELRTSTGSSLWLSRN